MKHKPRRVKRPKVQGMAIDSVRDLECYPFEEEEEDELKMTKSRIYALERNICQAIRHKRLNVFVSRSVIEASMFQVWDVEDPTLVRITPSIVKKLHVIEWMVRKMIRIEEGTFRGTKSRKVTSQRDETIFEVEPLVLDSVPSKKMYSRLSVPRRLELDRHPLYVWNRATELVISEHELSFKS